MGPNTPGLRWVDRVVAAIAFVIFAAAAYRVATVAGWQLAAPFDLLFESPNLATVEALRRGANIYNADVYNAQPFVFTMYTPLYHLLCAALPASASNPFLTGRLVALGFLAAALLCVPFAGPPGKRSSALLWIGAFLLLHPVILNSAFLKNDSTALFLSILAVVLASRAGDRPVPLAGAALCCVLAIGAKQVYVAAAASCFLFFLGASRRRAIIFALWLLTFSAIGACAAQATWGSGFWWCVFKAPQLPLKAARSFLFYESMLWQPAFLLLVLAAGFTAIEFIRRKAACAWLSNIYLIYLVVSGAVLLIALPKPGSSTNYFIEPCLAAVCWLVSVSAESWLMTTASPILATVAAAFTACQIAMAGQHEYTFACPSESAKRMDQRKDIQKETRYYSPATQNLTILNLAGTRAYSDLPGVASINDPYLYSLLWTHGTLSPDHLITEINARRFDTVVFTVGTAISGKPRTDPLSRVTRAIAANYRRAGSGETLQYWVRIDADQKH